MKEALAFLAIALANASPDANRQAIWDMLRNAKPEPLITPGARTMADWAKEGNRVFHELDLRAHLRSRPRGNTSFR
jgi:hypothetical protein